MPSFRLESISRLLFRRILSSIAVSLVFLLCFIHHAVATHSMGADLTYECLGGNTYKLRVSFYRDCIGISAPTFVDISITSDSCGHYLYEYAYPVAGTGTEITPICPSDSSTCNGGVFTGIQEYIYECTVVLPADCPDWTFTYSLCCRNGAITTINNPLNEDIYIYSTLDNTNNVCNNSPVFSNEPVPFVCLGQQFCFNHGASDPDGDSLAYSLITPLSVGGFPVSYMPPYSPTQPLNSVPPMIFNPLTGDFCLTPTSMEVTVMAVLVEEYRDGVLIGSVERDMQITVITCDNALPYLSGINGTTEHTTTVCEGEQVCFDLFSNDVDTGQNLTITWDGSLPGAAFNVNSAQHPQATFCWTPPAASTIPYCFTAKVSDDACPFYGSQVFAYCITVVDLEVDAGSDQDVGCDSSALLTASAAGYGTVSYLWSTGDTSSAISAGTGTYIVTATSGLCSVSDSVSVTSSVAPTAGYTFSSFCHGDSVYFTDQSTGNNIVSWNWSFGDGNGSTVQHPAYIYSQTGLYEICLTVENDIGCESQFCKTIDVQEGPVPLFTVGDGCAGSELMLTNISTGSQFNWNFGNGTTSSQQNPVIVYNVPGNYQVTLTVADSNGCAGTAAAQVTVHSIPDASFTYQLPAGCSSGPVVFTPSDTLINNSYQWLFNSAVSNQVFPQQVLPTGANNVTLVIANSSGCSDTSSQTVHVYPAFTLPPIPGVSACAGEVMQLNCPAGTAWLWSSGDTTSVISVTAQNTATYTVTVTDASGCTDTAEVLMEVHPLPVINAGNDVSICSGDSVLLTASVSAGITWLPAGISSQSILLAPQMSSWFTAVVTDTNSCTNSDSVFVTVNEPPSVSMNDTVLCAGSSVQLDAGNSGQFFLWNTGDTSQVLSIVQAGNYTVTVSNQWNCQSTASALVTNGGNTDDSTSLTFCAGNTVQLSAPGSGISYSWSNGATANAISAVSAGLYSVSVTHANGCISYAEFLLNEEPLPVAGISHNTLCAGDVVSFFENCMSSSAIKDFHWDFGNGLVSLQDNPQTVYSVPGVYNVQLSITTLNNCMDTVVLPLTIHPPPVAAFSVDDGCEGSVLMFSNNSAGQIISNAWNFGNGTSDTAFAPACTFTAAGTYAVELITLSSDGCTDTIINSVVVHGLPEVNFAASPVCAGQPVVFTNQGSSDTTGTWMWDFGDGASDSGYDAQHTYNQAGVYIATLSVIDENGCTGSFSADAIVYDLPDASFAFTPACVDEPTGFFAGNYLYYQWDFGDGGYSHNNPTLHAYAAEGPFAVTLTVADSNGCTASSSQQVASYPVPVSSFSYTPACEKQLCSFINNSSVSTGMLNYIWDMGDGTVVNGSLPAHIYNSAGRYTVQLTAVSMQGCTAISVQPVYVNPVPVLQFTAEPVPGCGKSDVHFTSEVQGAFAVSYQWDFGDGNQSSSEHPVHVYSSASYFTVSLTVVSDSGCMASGDTVIANEFLPSPEAGFEVHNINNLHSTYSFENTSVNSDHWNWSLGDGFQSSDFNCQHSYAEEGNYLIMLVAGNQWGCTDTALREIKVRPEWTCFVPNAFSPNNDGRNDVFDVMGQGISGYVMHIYNRWGAIIYKGSESWNGMVNDEPAQQDVYYYLLKVEDTENQVHEMTGMVTLLR